MRVAKGQLRIAVLTVMAVAGTSCQSAKKPVAVAAPAPPPLSAKAHATVPPQTSPAAPPAVSNSQQPPQALPVQPEPSAPKAASDEIDALISRVEKSYQTGLANYQAGHTDTAKQNFDDAFN